MLYLLDTNILIAAKNTYYPIESVPEFWDWLEHHGNHGNLKIPAEMMDEIRLGRREDALFTWIADAARQGALLFPEQPDPALVRRVFAEGYGPDLSDEEIQTIGLDPFLVAYGLAEPGKRCIVTNEASKPKAQRQNRRIPDVCRALGVPWCDLFQLNRALQFRTNWRTFSA